MGVRLLISRLASSQTRDSAARGLAVLCGFGFLLTVMILAARDGLERWFFALLVWALFIYAPLRILIEAAGTLAPGLRQRLAAEAVQGAARFGAIAGIELAVDRLMERDVVMPRIATPAEKEKARSGARAVLLGLRTNVGGLPPVVTAALGCLDHWVQDIGPWVRREAGQNIQARWREVRALAAMAAMTRILAAAGESAQVNSRGPASPTDSPRSSALAPGRVGSAPAGYEHDHLSSGREEFLDACLDYCDELALEVDVRLWEGPTPTHRVNADYAVVLRDAWRTYAETGAPALEARKAFVTLLLASPRPVPPSAS